MRFARGRTNSFHCRHLLCLVSRLVKFSRVKDQKEVCLLSQSGDVVDFADAASIRSATERSSLSPSSVARTSIDHLTVTFPRKEKYGFTLFRWRDTVG